MRVKARELRDMGVQELQEKEKALSQELFNLQLQKAAGQLGNTAMIGRTKKSLARVKTVLRELGSRAA